LIKSKIFLIQSLYNRFSSSFIRNRQPKSTKEKQANNFKRSQL